MNEMDTKDHLSWIIVASSFWIKFIITKLWKLLVVLSPVGLLSNLVLPHFESDQTNWYNIEKDAMLAWV